MRSTVITAALIATGITSAAVYTSRGEEAPQLVTALVARGDIVETVAATGTLEAVTTVQVGSQLSGTVQALYADFNSMVRKGEVLARLDPSSYESQVEQARANLIRAQAEVERQAVVVDDAEVKLARARELSDKLLIAAVDLEAADVQVRSAEAQKKSSEAQVVQAQASLTQAEVNLEKTVISAPIDGVVIARSVDVGQTVAASLQAPTLYAIAADLTMMRVNASIDESDVGKVKPGQRVRFRVDAYPGEEFLGTVAQVRLSPIILQNVVTYAGVIDVANPELKLKPGMTATVDVEIARRDDVLCVPNGALRFDPTPVMLSALGLDAASVSNRTAKHSNNTGRVWMSESGTIIPKTVSLGFSNGTLTEVTSDDLPEDGEVVTSVNLGGRQPVRTTGNPLFMMPPGGGRGR